MKTTTIRRARAVPTVIAVFVLVAGCSNVSSVPDTRRDQATDGSVFYFEGDGVPAGSGYTYAQTHGMYMHSALIDSGREAEFAYLVESRIQTWIPDHYADEWLHRNTVSEPTEWILGSPDQMAALSVDESGASVDELHARCGDTNAMNDRREQCTAPPTWHRPSRAFLAALPTDPHQLHERLLADTGFAPDQATDILALAAAALKTGTVPGEIRANLIAALKLDPGITVTEAVPNFDGVLGRAYTATDHLGHVTDLIIDPLGDRLIGERVIVTTGARPPLDGVVYTLAPGTVIGHTAVGYGRADRLGDAPA